MHWHLDLVNILRTQTLNRAPGCEVVWVAGNRHCVVNGADERRNCGGERYANFIRNVGSTVFRDVAGDELLRFNNHLLNYGDEAGLEALAATGLSPDYVFRVTQRALVGVQGKCRVLPGIDIGIPTAKSTRKASPENTCAAVAAALKAGADGLILSRNYSEMPLANVAAAGRTVRDAGKL